MSVKKGWILCRVARVLSTERLLVESGRLKNKYWRERGRYNRMRTTCSFGVKIKPPLAKHSQFLKSLLFEDEQFFYLMFSYNCVNFS